MKDNSYTGCSLYNSFTTNTYAFESRTGKVRMITVQEAHELRCTNLDVLCPSWMRTENDYWTMSANSLDARFAWDVVTRNGNLYNYVGTTDSNRGARAVIEISKYI